jgi:lysozyme
MDIFEQLRRDEGVRRFPYKDINGHTTTGVGRNLDAVPLSDDEIELMLQNDVKRALTALETRLPWYPAVDPIRQAVLQNMCVNLGFEGLEEFKEMLAAVAQGDWRKAAQEMLNSKWAAQVGKEPGERADRLAYQMREGIWV